MRWTFKLQLKFLSSSKLDYIELGFSASEFSFILFFTGIAKEKLDGNLNLK
jgi:hypothetical protein